jgi:hypothetical protein
MNPVDPSNWFHTGGIGVELPYLDVIVADIRTSKWPKLRSGLGA